MRNVLTTLVELSGFALLTVAGFHVDEALGYATGGLSCLAIGYLAGR